MLEGARRRGFVSPLSVDGSRTRMNYKVVSAQLLEKAKAACPYGGYEDGRRQKGRSASSDKIAPEGPRPRSTAPWRSSNKLCRNKLRRRGAGRLILLRESNYAVGNFVRTSSRIYYGREETDAGRAVGLTTR